MFESFRNLTPFGGVTFIVDVSRVVVGFVFTARFPVEDYTLDTVMPSIVYIRAGVLCLIIYMVMVPALIRILVLDYEHYIAGA